MRLLMEHRTLLEGIAEALLERETLDREEIDRLAAGRPLPALRQPDAEAAAADAGAVAEGLVPALGQPKDGEADVDAEVEVESTRLSSRAAREDAASRVRSTEVEPDPSR